MAKAQEGTRTRVSALATECIERHQAAPGTAPRPYTALPVPAGGMNVERVPELVKFYGSDAMLLIGGSLYAAGDALFARSREFVASAAGGSQT